jgi:hypothetical protein
VVGGDGCRLFVNDWFWYDRRGDVVRCVDHGLWQDFRCGVGGKGLGIGEGHGGRGMGESEGEGGRECRAVDPRVYGI